MLIIIGSSYTDPLMSLHLVNELFKYCVMDVFKSSLELGQKSGSAVTKSGGNGNASPLHCQESHG